ncbi:MAG: hypothetical protein P8Y48_18255, partial [Novosphingobium sp.]
NGMARALSAVASIAVFVIVGLQVAYFGFGRLFEMLPSAPAFFLILLALHLVLPVSEWVIYRRLWAIPVSGIVPLLRKGVINDLVLSYGGELYLYDWARKRVKEGVMSFQAIKDVSILSAMVANLVTVAMVVVTARWVYPVISPGYVAPLACSVALLLGIPLLIGLFANRVFSLTWRDIRFISIVHIGRTAISVALTAMLWMCILPEIAFQQLLALQILRLLVSRMPLVPNDDILFASITILIVGYDSAVSMAASLTAMSLAALHIATFALLLVGDLIARLWRAQDAR